MKLRFMNTQPMIRAPMAMSSAALTRVPATSTGSMALAWNILVWGKLKPSGSFQGPCTSQDTTSWAT